MYLFSLAERLGMTVAEISQRMMAPELAEWAAFDALRAEERERAERLASKGMRGR